MRVEGIDDFTRAIAELTRDMRRRVIRAALRAAAKPIAQAMKANSKVLKTPHKHRTAGLMRDSVKVTASRLHNGRNGVIGVFVRPRAKGARGAKSATDPFYYRFVAGGFHAVGRKRVAGGRLTRSANLAARVRAGTARFVPGDDYIGRAFAAQSGNALRIFQQKLRARIDAANRRK